MTEATVGPDRILRHAGQQYRVALGRSGLTADKREGDGATPIGTLKLRRVLYRADRLPRPKSTLPTAPLAPHDGWCDDPADAAYNRLIRLPHPARHEELWRGDAVYDVIAVLGWNDDPVEKDRGSAIFMHVARPGLSPTEGCIALELADLLALLASGVTAVRVG